MLQERPAGGKEVERFLTDAAAALCPNASVENIIDALSRTTPTVLVTPDVHKRLFTPSLLVLPAPATQEPQGLPAPWPD